MRTTKSNPKPVRLDREEDDLLLSISQKTGVPQVELIRRALRFALPKFENGDANILDYGRPRETEDAA